MPQVDRNYYAHESDNFDSPERRLFIAVLGQAVHDAFSIHVPPFEKQQARAWLLGNSGDFKGICENAGRNFEYVRAKIRKKILKDNGWNLDIPARFKSSPKRLRQMKKYRKNNKPLTGNAYYASKKKTSRIGELTGGPASLRMQ